ncbi:12416_t:CDS:2, partial [Acaulospora morrowiae]
IIGWLLDFILLNQSLLMSIIYLWSQQYRDSIVTFIFGLRFKGVYFPWVLLAFDALQMGGALPWHTLIGIVTGHIYYFLQELYPASGGPRLLNTPQWLYQQFPPTNGIRTSFGTTVLPPRNSSENQPTSAHRWGRGQRLGT